MGPITLAPLIHLLDGQAAKLAQVYSDLGIGGSQVTQLVEELVNQGYNVLVCSTDRKIKDPVYLPGTKLSVLFVPYQAPVKRVLTVYRAERKSIATAVREFSPDIVHAHWTYEFALAAIDTKLRHLITVRDHPIQVIREMSDKPYRFYRLIIHCLVAYRGKAFTANSPVTAKVIPKKKLKAIIPNGVNDKYIQYAAEEKPHSNEITICSIGSADRSKNIRAVIDAVTQIVKRGHPIRLCLIGPGLAPGTLLHEHAKSIGAEAIISMMGVLPHTEVIRLIASSHLYVHPSKLESFGNPVVEAMLVGTPCIVPKVGQGPEWILENGRYGTIAESADSADIQSAIISFLSDAKSADSKVALAKQRAQDQLSIANVTEKYINVYEQLATYR